MFQKALKIRHKQSKFYTVNRSVNNMESANIKKPEPAIKQTLSNNETKVLSDPDELNIVIDLNKNNLIQGLIMSEILGRPKAIKSRGNFTWNSRF